MPSLQQLKYFAKTAEVGSLNRASKELFISQPALTKQLAQLEKKLGTTLFIRTSNGMKITDAGSYLYENLSLLIGKLDHILAETKAIGSQKSLRVGALPSLATYYLPPLLSKLVETHADKTQLIIRDTTHELINMLYDGEADVIFVQDYSNQSDFPSITIETEPYLAVIPAHHPLATQANVTMEDLAQYPLVMHKSPCDIRTSLLRYCDERGLQLSASIELEFNESIIRFVENGFGVSIIPQMMAAALSANSVTVKELLPSSFSRSIHLLYHPTSELVAQQIMNNLHI